MTAVFRALLVAVLMISIGLHWALLQSVAWVGMAVAYTVEKGSLTEGLSDTFDGDHPCPLCHMVAQAAKAGSSEKNKAPAKEGKELKLVLAFVSIPRFVFEAPPMASWITESQQAQPRPEPPEAPPPRTQNVV